MKDYLINIDDYLILSSDNKANSFEDELDELRLALIDEFGMDEFVEGEIFNSSENDFIPSLVFVDKQRLH